MASSPFPPLGGFDLNDLPQPSSLLAILKSPCTAYQSNGRLNVTSSGENTNTVESNLVVLFRAANFYIDFRDLPDYFIAYVSNGLTWPHDECAAILHQYIAARKLYLARLDLITPEPRTETAKFICDLVDNLWSTPEPRWLFTRDRKEFLDQHRDYWELVVRQNSAESDILDPSFAFPAPPVPADADWLNPRGQLHSEAAVLADNLKHPGSVVHGDVSREHENCQIIAHQGRPSPKT